MRPLKTRKPFTLYKKETKSGAVWYARFWDGTLQRYAITKSTGIPVEGKRQRRYEAEEAARALLPGVLSVKTLEKSGKPFTRYITDFWTSDSPYVRECAQVKKKPLSGAYIRLHHDDVKRHIEPFPGFQGITLHSLTPGIIRDWMIWAAEKGLKGGRINKVLQAMTTPVRYAVSRGDLDHDPFRNIRPAPDTRREKGVLTPAEVSTLIRAPVTDPRNRLAVLLGLLCGLRLGEVRGLLWGDIEDGLITVRHNYIDQEGFKPPKQGSTGIVPVPESVQAAIEVVRRISRNPAADTLVMESLECPGKPLSKSHLEDALGKELAAIGIPGKWRPPPHPGRKLLGEQMKPPDGYMNEQQRRNLTFHGLRHTFVTLGRLAGISDLEIQALARHKTPAMMERYSHAAQVINFDAARGKIERAIEGVGNA